MGSSPDPRHPAPLRGFLRVRSLSDTQRAEERLRYLQSEGTLQFLYEQIAFSRCRLCCWAVGRWVLYLCGALWNLFQSYSLHRRLQDSGRSTLQLLLGCVRDAALFLLSAGPWLCCLWCLFCLFSSGSQPYPMCPHCLWCLPCLWLLPCLFCLWCLCIRKAHTLYVLYHSSTRDRLKLSGGSDSLDHLYLKYMTLKVGRTNLIVVIDGVTDAQTVKESIEKEEPTLGKCCVRIFVFQEVKQDSGGTDPNGEEASRLRDYVAGYFSPAQRAGSLFQS